MSFQRSLVLLLLGWVTAAAQQPAEVPPAPVTPTPAVPAPPPGVPVPGGGPQAPAGAPGARVAAEASVPKAGIPLGENKIVEDIIEPKLTGNALAGLYRKYTGRRVLTTAGAGAAELSFIQEASPQDPLTYAQAAELLRKAAVLENFVFVQHPQDPNLEILTLANGGPRPTNVKVDVFNENSKLPDTDVVITYVMTLSHIKPDQALNVFNQIIGQVGTYGSISAVPNASAVVITEKASLIKSLVELQKSIDVPGSVQSSKFIPVQFADVTEIANTLTELLTAQQTTQRTAGIQRTDGGGGGAQPQGGAQAQGAGGGGVGEETPVQILPEPRTNRIFAMGRPVDLLFVEGLVREFDIPTSDKTFLRRKLRFLTVSEFLPIAGDALTRAFTGSGEGGSGGGGSAAGGGQGGTRTQSNNRSTAGGGGASSRASRSSSNGSSSGLGGSSSGFGGGGAGGAGGSFGGGGTGGGSSLSDPNISSAPESLLVGRTLLVADNITNSVVAQGPPSALEIIERLLDQIDVKPDQVMISTVIGQLTLNDSVEYGAGYLFKGEHVRTGFGGGGIPILPLADDATNRFPRLDPSGLGAGGLRAIGKVDDLSIYMKALQTKGDFTVLSRPSIFTSNNQTGMISSGERIAIPTNSNSFSNGGASTNIEYQDVVLKLEVRPLVNSDNEITMEIALLNDEQNGTQIIQGAGSNGEDLEVPRISTREIITTATVPNNNTIVLGGLIVGKNNENVSGIPILSDIPLLGKLFSFTTDNNDRTELMVFIQPSIVKGDHSLNEVQTDMADRYKVSQDALKFADGNGQPGLNDVKTIDEKGKGGSGGSSSTSTGSNNMKPSLRPPHRR